MLRYLVDPIFQVINTAGKPATGGYIEVYLHGTRDKYYCASDFEGTLHPFKIPLDSLGSNIILADDANAYDIYAYNRYGSLLMSRYNVSVSSSGGGGSEAIRKGTIHKLGLWTVDESDPSPKPSEYWVLDLESPNDSAPGGYDRLTVERAREIHNSGSFFGLRTIHVHNPYEDNLLLETYYEYIAMAQTFELKLAYIDSLNQLAEYTLGNFGEFVGVSSVNEKNLTVGKLHRICPRSVLAGDPSPKPSTDWIVDLESPNPDEPDGYDRLTVERAREIHENGEIFVYSSTSPEGLASGCDNYYEALFTSSSGYVHMTLVKTGHHQSPNEISLATIDNYGDYLGISDAFQNSEYWNVTLVQEGSDVLKKNKIHRYSFGDGTVDGETPIYGSWLIDLDKPDPNGPEGYARVTPAEFWQSTAVNGEVPVYLQDKNANNSLTYAYLSRTDVTMSGSTVTSVFAYFVRSGYGNDLSEYKGFRFTKLAGSDYLQKATATEDYFAALSQTSGDARYLQLSGGTMTGPITLAADGLHTNNAAGFTADQYGNFKHARNNAADDWTLRANSGSATFSFNWETGVINIGKWEATKIGLAYGGTGATSASDARTNLDVYSKSEVDNALPQATSTTPSMDGTASVGSETRWAKGDHVHPTDTSREATANKTTTVRQNGQADNTKFPTEAAVRTAIDSAVSSAYHAAGSKTVAQLTSSLLVSANEGNVYNITDSGSTTSDFIEGAGLPISVGDNVVVCDVGGGVYKFDLLSGIVDLTNYLTKTGDGSDVTASFTAASTRTNLTTGEKLSILFGKIAKWFSDLKALAFKDKVSTSDIDDDSVTADKVMDNETLPVNITGYASHLRQAKCRFINTETGYRLMAHLPPKSGYSDTLYTFNIYENRDANILESGILKGVLSIHIRNNNGTYQYSGSYKGSSISNIDFEVRVDSSTHGVFVYAAKNNQYYANAVFELQNAFDGYGNDIQYVILYVDGVLQNSVSGDSVPIVFTLLKQSGGTIPLANSSGVGSASEPVYVSSNGEVLKCTTLWNSIKNNISSNTANVNQVDSNTETSSFVFVNNHVYHLTVHLQGSPLVTNSTSSGTGYVVAYIGSSLIQSHYSCRQFVDIQQGELTTKNIRLPIDWKAENIAGSSDNQLHVAVIFNGTRYGFSSVSDYELTLIGTDFDGA